MFKNIVRTFAAFLVLLAGIFGISMVFAPAAAADTAPAVSVSQSASTTSTTVTETSNGAFTEVMDIMAKGLPKRLQKTCVTLKKADTVYKVKGMTFKVGKKYYTNYWNASHQMVWHYKAAVVGDKFCVVGKKIVRAQCGNEARGNPLGPVVRWIKVVKRFSFTATATATTTSPVTATATAVCSVNGANANATATATAQATATASITVKGFDRFMVQATARSQAEAAANASYLTVRAAVTAQVTATATATATASCSSTTPPPPNPPGSKDGTQTPPTSVIPDNAAPGPNPAPSDTVSSPCYDENTGNPVARVDGLCPVGSRG